VLNPPPYAAAVAEDVARRPFAQWRTYLRWTLVRAKVLEKFAAFRAKIGYPDKWKCYAGLVVAHDSSAANVRRARDWDTEDELAKLGQPVDPDEWGMTPPTVNAYFPSTRNEIVFPAGILSRRSSTWRRTTR